MVIYYWMNALLPWEGHVPSLIAKFDVWAQINTNYLKTTLNNYHLNKKLSRSVVDTPTITAYQITDNNHGMNN